MSKREAMLYRWITRTLAATHGRGLRPDIGVVFLRDAQGRAVASVTIAVGLETVAKVDEAAQDAASKIHWAGRKCRFCGCTALCACPGCCSWIAPRVCSRCAELWAVEKDRKRLVQKIKKTPIIRKSGR